MSQKIPLSILFTGRTETGLTAILNLGGIRLDLAGWRKGTDPEFSVVVAEATIPDDAPDEWLRALVDDLAGRARA